MKTDFTLGEKTKEMLLEAATIDLADVNRSRKLKEMRARLERRIAKIDERLVALSGKGVSAMMTKKKLIEASWRVENRINRRPMEWRPMKARTRSASPTS